MDIDKLHPTYLHHVDMKIAPMAQRDLHHSSAGPIDGCVHSDSQLRVPTGENSWIWDAMNTTDRDKKMYS
jgi:hypothetical protein